MSSLMAKSDLFIQYFMSDLADKRSGDNSKC